MTPVATPAETWMPATTYDRVDHAQKHVEAQQPYKDYPLYAHASGRWAKKAAESLAPFGPRNDPQGAVNRWLDQKDDFSLAANPGP